MNLQEFSHKRFNILTREWVLVSPHRSKRPWQGQQEEIVQEKRPSYDANCYLCAGNTRANGEVNPKYTDVYIFDNDFAALQQEAPNDLVANGLLQSQFEQGVCRVICFSPDHSKSLADMRVEEITQVVKAWKHEYETLGKHDFINYVQIFENKGSVMGCSNPHPHGQIWSQSSLPNEVQKKDDAQKHYFSKKHSSLLGDYLQQELTLKERIIYENDDFVVLIPFWAVWPYETMIVPKQHWAHIGQLNTSNEVNFAKAISKITSAYDKVFQCPFPYSAGIHQAPTHGQDTSYWHFHMSFYPPLLRSASVKKFMVGYEMFGSPQRDITAEQAAERLKTLI